ncbi:hypothetical protein KO494_01310 [Lacinutrix sp. C3R15]|uniref:hypothetical protein n=1 Tax=Flavobacteriaceae TaxID=49546 RepID=UPI001C08766F|nr:MULTISPECIES: hypothetical protein [Flavobacteriaceae]MBU2938165.1 hypothetical protein [Lacinutrix sp. C3R15]MDO6621479.1 hypothetical protein [Oceanihabitans sp. 1_MG-2023]
MLYKKLPSGRFLKKISKCVFKRNKTIQSVSKNDDKILVLENNSEASNLQVVKIDVVDKSIKNLEFINHLEMNLKDKQLDNLPMEFLTDLKQQKQHSQKNLLINLESKDHKK